MSTRSVRLNAKLEKLEEKANKLREKQRKVEEEMQNLRHKVQTVKRKKITRINSIIGAMVLKSVDRGTYPKDKLLAELEAYVSTERDRKLLEEFTAYLTAEEE